MEMGEWLITAIAAILDVFTCIFRFAYSVAAGEESSAFGVVANTWFVGTAGTLLAALLIALIWDAAFWSIRWRSKQILTAALRGAGPSMGQKMALRFAVFDQSIGIVQRLSGVRRGYLVSDRSSSFSGSDARAWIARFVIWLPAALIGAVRFIVQPTVILLFGLSCVAVWWVIFDPELESLTISTAEYIRTIPFAVNPVTVSAVGVSIAVLTFVLGRFGNAKVRGHQEWLRSESAKASEELAERAHVLTDVNSELLESLWAIYLRWDSSRRGFDTRSKAKRLSYERELRIRLSLVVSDELERSVSKDRAHDSLWKLRPPTAADRAIENFDEAVEVIADHLQQSDQRSETRLFQSVPWKVARRARARVLDLYVARISSSSSDSTFAEPTLSPLSQWLGPLIFRHEGVFPTAEREEGFDFSAIELEKRQKVLDKATELWKNEIKEQRLRLDRDVERQRVRLLLSIAELQLAAKRIWSYLHPTNGLANFVDWLRRT